MAKIGFLGSSFDPITNGHLVTIQEIQNRLGFDKIYLMPSSSGRKDKTANVSDEHRVNMVKLAISDNPNLDIETIELEANAWDLYTYKTLRKLKEKYPNDDIYFLMGADLLVDIADGKWNNTPGNWTHVEDLLSENKFVVVRRNGVDMHEIVAKNKLLRKYESHFDFIYNGVDNNISSSYIREGFEIGHNPRYYMPKEVYNYIKEHELYVSNE